MNLSRLIQIVLAAATVLSNVLFGMGQRSILLSLAPDPMTTIGA